MQGPREKQGEMTRASQVSDAKKNRVGKTRDLFKKIGDTKEEFHTKAQ